MILAVRATALLLDARTPVLGPQAQPLRPGKTVKRQKAAAAEVKTWVGKKDHTGIGGTVYATGLGEVTVTMHPAHEFLSDQFYPYETRSFFGWVTSRCRLG